MANTMFIWYTCCKDYIKGKVSLNTKKWSFKFPAFKKIKTLNSSGKFNSNPLCTISLCFVLYYNNWTSHCHLPSLLLSLSPLLLFVFPFVFPPGLIYHAIFASFLSSSSFSVCCSRHKESPGSQFSRLSPMTAKQQNGRSTLSSASLSHRYPVSLLLY